MSQGLSGAPQPIPASYSPISPQPQIQSRSPSASQIPGPPGQRDVQIITVPPLSSTTAAAAKNTTATSSASGGQKQVPPLRAEDANNFDMMVVKSIYNIVG